jgi:hypothetical protein
MRQPKPNRVPFFANTPLPLNPVAPLLESLALHFSVSHQDPRLLVFGLSGTTGRFPGHCRFDEDNQLVILNFIIPLFALPPARAETLRLLNWLNLKLPGPAFRLDLDDGEIAFRHALAHTPAAPLSLAQLQHALALSLDTLESTLHIILDVALGRLTCQQAIAHACPKSGAN